MTGNPTLAQLVDYFGADIRAANDVAPLFGSAAASDENVYDRAAKATNGEKFVRLWNGDASAVEGFDKSGSAVDQALVNFLAFHSKDPRQVETLWLRSPQGQREKTQTRAKYRQDTIARAFDRAVPAGDFSAINGQLAAIVQASAAPAWPEFGPIGENEWAFAKSSPRAIIEDLIYEDVGVLIAAGGQGKTTLTLAIAIHVVLGLEFCGHKIASPGSVVILTAEDSREMLVARLRRIATEMLPHGTMPDGERATKIAAIRAGIIIVDVSSRVQRLTVVDRDVVRVDDAAVDGLAGFLAPLQPSLLLIDPAVSFGVGEGRVNDAEQGLIEAGRRLRRALSCAVIYVHHTGKANAREKTEDQYSGRGGSAFADGSRMVFVMNRLTPKDWQAETGRTLEPHETGLKVNVAKLSYADSQRPLYLIRKGYRFDHVEAVAHSDDDRDTTDDETVIAFISAGRAEGGAHSRKTLEEAGVGLSRARLRNAVSRLLEIGRIAEHVEPGKATALIPTTVAAPIGEGS